MTLEEFAKLVESAAKQRKGKIRLGHVDGKWCVQKPGPLNEDLGDATFEQVIKRLKQWEKPIFTTITVPTASAESFVDKNASGERGGYVEAYFDATVKALKENGVLS